MVLLLHWFLIYYLIIWKPCFSVVNVYYMGNEKRMRGKLIKLIEELVLDATAKITSVQQFKTEFSKSKPYQYGNLMYEINSRHAKMVKLYARVENFITANPLNPIVDKDLKYNEFNYIVFDALEQIDTMGHEIENFVAMIYLREANRHADKSKAGWNLHFRRKNKAQQNGAWLQLVDSLADKDSNDLPEQVVEVPEENNQTHIGKRKNGVWHEAVPKE